MTPGIPIVAITMPGLPTRIIGTKGHFNLFEQTKKQEFNTMTSEIHNRRHHHVGATKIIKERKNRAKGLILERDMEHQAMEIYCR